MIFTISRYGNNLEERVAWAEQNTNLISEIVIIAVFEIDLYGFEFTDRLIALQKPITVLVGSIQQNTDNLNKFSNVIYWPTYWLTETFVRLTNLDNKKINESLGLYLDKPQSIKNFDRLFITMNKAPKFHRALFMDLLYKHRLFKDGYLIYRELSRYNFQYWKQEVLLLDQKDQNILFNQEIVPLEYNKSLFQIVTESHENYFFLTEKTAIPLFFEKPFIVVGNKHFHKQLKEFGFALYDELFDYSFDDIDDITLRYETLVKSISKISYNFDLHQIKKKLEYNKQLAIHMATNTENFPKIWNKLAIKANEHLNPDPYHINSIIKNETL